MVMYFVFEDRLVRWVVRACLRMYAPREYKKRLFRIEDSPGPNVENLERLP
ncbi:uncharacterized protein RSE6_10783 [Rhynchosporium secalis]|uniref:Uncharacterized protein n=1 Tax=Rhynchosporium secalis TaxID=38038 RepID=A0A1E1MLA8_RHYSE|nr:uncharacterized protein RSE6_10783 [Rhynchosporium secalis]